MTADRFVILFDCRWCGHQLKAAVMMAGRVTPCPACDCRLPVPVRRVCPPPPSETYWNSLRPLHRVS